MYFAVYSTLLILGMSVRRRQAAVFLFGIFAFLLWFMGWRYYVGCDFTGYLNRFRIAEPTVVIGDILAGSEPGFALLIRSVRAFDLDYVWLNVFASALILYGFRRFLRAFDFQIMILALLFPILIIQLGMSGIRQALAVAFVMASAIDFIRGRRLATGLWIVAGATFHASAIMFLPIALLAGRTVSLGRLTIGVIVALPVATFLLGDRLEVYQDRYIDQIYGEISSGGAFIRYAMIMLPSLMFLVFHERLKDFAPRQYELFKLFVLISFALGPIGLVSSLALHRLNYYVMPFSIATLVYLVVAVAPKSQSSRAAMLLIPAALYGGYMIFWFLQSRHARLCYTPYQNYLTL